jgi:hypothetical protein
MEEESFPWLASTVMKQSSLILNTK